MKLKPFKIVKSKRTLPQKNYSKMANKYGLQDCACCGTITSKATWVKDWPFRRFLCERCLYGGGNLSHGSGGIVYYLPNVPGTLPNRDFYYACQVIGGEPLPRHRAWQSYNEKFKNGIEDIKVKPTKAQKEEYEEKIKEKEEEIKNQIKKNRKKKFKRIDWFNGESASISKTTTRQSHYNKNYKASPVTYMGLQQKRPKKYGRMI